MANFLSSCACRGAKPNSVELNNKKVREHLIARLLSQRQVLRFISAPNGFGKSTLIAQYAELVFSFKNCFWINCESPCFIRDLDSNDLVSLIIQLCPEPNLVVFDNLTLLNESRINKLSKAIDDLLAYGSEVIIATSPYNDAILKQQPDCMVFDSYDLLLNDEEFEKMTKLQNNTKSIEKINRISQIAWSTNKINNLLKLAITEDFTDSMIFILFYVYLLGECSLYEIKTFLSKTELNLFLESYKQYVYFGYDESNSNFSVPKISPQDLLRIFNSKFKILYKYFNVISKSKLCNKLVAILDKKKSYEKAVQISLYIGDVKSKIALLEKWDELSIRYCMLNSFTDSYKSVLKSINKNDITACFNSLRLALLSDRNSAIRCSYKILDNKSTHIDNKLFAALIFMRFGSSSEKAQAIKLIRCLNNEFKVEALLSGDSLKEEQKFKCQLISRILNIYLAVYSESLNPFDQWLNSANKNLSDVDMISAECLLSAITEVRPRHIESVSFVKFINFISRNLSKIKEFNFYTFGLLKAYMDVVADINDDNLSVFWTSYPEIYKSYKFWEKHFKDEKRIYQKKLESESFYLAESEFNLLNSNEDRSNKKVDSKLYAIDDGIPIIDLRLFGGLSASMGNKQLINTNFGRQNIKVLCCILAIENGQEINKDDLSELIWPRSDVESRRININVHWSALRRVLTLPNRNCPYLIRNQHSYAFNMRYINCDIQKIEHICAELTMGSIDSKAWWDRLQKNENIINGDLLPSESRNIYILNKRTEYKNLIVNALIAASDRLVEAGEAHQALWFANKAMSRDPMREDVYIALMKAQMEAGQRTPAIETYFACKKFLKSELGIDPSNRISFLYKRILEDKAVLV